MSSSKTSTATSNHENPFLSHLTKLSFSSKQPSSSTSCSARLSAMLALLNRKFRRLCSKLRWSRRKTSKPKIVVRLNKAKNSADNFSSQFQAMRTHDRPQTPEISKTIRIATFNAALFSMAQAVPKPLSSEESFREMDLKGKSLNDRPKSILKQKSVSHSMNDPNEFSPSKRYKSQGSKLRVSINLPDNEISIGRSRQLKIIENEEGTEKAWVLSNGDVRIRREKGPMRPSLSLPAQRIREKESENLRNRTVLEVLKEVEADILALQDVKAEEERGMKPLSDLAEGLGMKYVFAESWAPEYGNAVLSKWPIKRWQAQKIFDDSDFRNVLKVVVDVPTAGEVNVYCTHLDHLDENWRMKQITAILQGSDGPHILTGGLNSLDETDYSEERWTDIVKYYQEIGKPTPKVEIMKFLKGKRYTDAKNFVGECESVVMLAKGQDVQGTCKYGTRVDYILASPDSPYRFVPGSYTVISSKGTSNHHIVKADIQVSSLPNGSTCAPYKPKTVRIQKSTSRGIWRTTS
ncbi:hypothetical protein AMTRI_Chr12g275420 [Amborella trichopoda]